MRVVVLFACRSCGNKQATEQEIHLPKKCLACGNRIDFRVSGVFEKSYWKKGDYK